MFFIGFFGIDSKVKPAGYLAVTGGCPCCGSGQKLHLARRYQYFHAFFIPLVKFHSSYLATCPDCASVFEVSEAAGSDCEKNGTAQCGESELNLLQNNLRPRCKGCGTALSGDEHFCPSCGRPQNSNPDNF